jgi:hypothetical protein
VLPYEPVGPRARVLVVNLLGSLLGGVASMLSMAFGFRALMFLTLGVYLGALLLLRRGPAHAAA